MRPRKSLALRWNPHHKRREYQITLYGSDGKRHTRWLNTTDKGKAQQILDETLRQREILRRELTSPLISTLVERYLKERTPYIRPNTLRSYTDSLAMFRKWLERRGIIHLESLAQIDIRGYVPYLSAKYSPASVNIHLRSAAAFCRYYDLDRLAKRHLKQIRVKPKVKRILSRAEIDKLLDVTGGDLKDMILALSLTGMRRGELINLTWEQIDFKRRVIRVKGKGERERLVPLLPPLAKLFSKRRRNGTYVFPFQRNPKYFNTLFNKAVLAAEIPRCTPHDLRRTVATRLLEKGVSDKLIQALLGHVSLDTTYTSYIEVSDDLREGTMQLVMLHRSNTRP